MIILLLVIYLFILVKLKIKHIGYIHTGLMEDFHQQGFATKCLMKVYNGLCPED